MRAVFALPRSMSLSSTTSAITPVFQTSSGFIEQVDKLSATIT